MASWPTHSASERMKLAFVSPWEHSVVTFFGWHSERACCLSLLASESVSSAPQSSRDSSAPCCTRRPRPTRSRSLRLPCCWQPLPCLLVSFLHNALRKLIRSSRYARIDSKRRIFSHERSARPIWIPRRAGSTTSFPLTPQLRSCTFDSRAHNGAKFAPRRQLNELSENRSDLAQRQNDRMGRRKDPRPVSRHHVCRLLLEKNKYTLTFMCRYS